MKKIPVNVRVLRAVATTMPKGAKVKDIVKITGMASQSVSACLWKLKDQGKINRDDGFYKTNDYVLTDVNKPVETIPATLEANDESETLTLELETKSGSSLANPVAVGDGQQVQVSVAKL